MAAVDEQEISMQRAGDSKHDYRASRSKKQLVENDRSEEDIEKDAKVEGHKKFMYVQGEYICAIMLVLSMCFTLCAQRHIRTIHTVSVWSVTRWVISFIGCDCTLIC